MSLLIGENLKLTLFAIINIRSLFSYFVIGRYYAKINELMKKLKKDKIETVGVDFYNLNKTQNGMIEIYMPFGENVEKYLISTLPQPEYIADC